MVNKNDVRALLTKLGVKSSDTVMIHTSMRAIGGVEGGCDGLIDAFRDYLSDGLFLIPTHTWANVNAKQPIYDVRSTEPCIGALPTVAAFRKDGVRSLHPTHSIAAFGARAEEFVSGEETAATPCSEGGAWRRLYDEDAWIILLGVGLDKNTYIHAVDEILDLSGKLGDIRELTVIDREGGEHKTLFRPHGHATSQYFVNYQKPLDELSVLSYGKLGDATVTAMRARELTRVLLHIWKSAEWDLTEEYREIPVSYYAELK
jgi:aminoglycoside 3-N-acetyltransferase